MLLTVTYHQGNVDPPSPYIVLCGNESFSFARVLRPALSFEPYYIGDEFFEGLPKDKEENKELDSFQDKGFFRRGPARGFVVPPERPFLTVGIKRTVTSRTLMPVTFLVDTGAPNTYISEKAANTMDLDKGSVFEYDGYKIVIGKKQIVAKAVKDDDSRLAGVNLFGTDLIYLGVLAVDYRNSIIKFDHDL